jgi:hypothetical protein
MKVGARLVQRRPETSLRHCYLAKGMAIVGFLLVGVITLYFRFFPVIISPLVSDLLVGGLLFVLFILLVASVVGFAYSRWYLLAFTAVIPLIVVVRSIRYFRTLYPALWDPYVFLLVWDHLITDGLTLEADYVARYADLSGLLHWPHMYLLSEILRQTTGLSQLWLFRFQAPLLGVLFFGGIFILARSVTDSSVVALFASLISTFASHVIFYQSEYHPQSIALVVLPFILFVLISIPFRAEKRFFVLSATFFGAIISAHYFTSLFFVIVFGALFAIVTGAGIAHDRFQWWSYNFQITRWWSVAVGLFVVAGTLYHLLVYPEFILGWAELLVGETPQEEEIVVAGETPLLSRAIWNSRWVVFGLALPALAYAVYRRDPPTLQLAVIVGLLLSIGLLAQYGIFLDLGRVVLFYETVVGVFSAITLGWLVRTDRSTAVRVLTAIAVVVIVAVLLTLSTLGGHYMTSYYFHSVEEDEAYWNQNRVPVTEAYPPAGHWLESHHVDGERVMSDEGDFGFAVTAPFYWGGLEEDDLTRLPEPYLLAELELDEESEFQLAVLNDAYTYEETTTEWNRIYSNGELTVYRN